MCKCIHNHKIDVLYGFEKIFENNMLTRSTKKIFIPMRNTGILGGGPFGHQTTGRRAVPLRRRTFGRRLVRLVLAPDSPCAQMYGAQMAAPNRRRPNVPDPWKWGRINRKFSTFHPMNRFQQNLASKHNVRKIKLFGWRTISDIGHTFRNILMYKIKRIQSESNSVLVL